MKKQNTKTSNRSSSNGNKRISQNKERTYVSHSRSPVYSNTLARRSNQRTGQYRGLWFTKIIIQTALCILFYFVVYTIVTDYAKESYDFAYQIFGDVCVEPSSEKKVKVTIPENASLKEVASLLADKELIKNEYSFYIRGKLSTNKKREIIPGTYVLYASDNYEDILNVLTQSDNVE